MDESFEGDNSEKGEKGAFDSKTVVAVDGVVLPLVQVQVAPDCEE